LNSLLFSAKRLQKRFGNIWFRNRESKAATARRKGQLEKQKTVGECRYLFVLRQIKNEFVKTQDEELRKLTENAVQKLYREISDKSKKNAKIGCYNIIRPHTM
jgi:hypothetical protein